MTSVELKVLEILGGQEAIAEEIIKIFRDILTDENIQEMEKMISDSSLSLDEVVKHFLESGQLRNLSVVDKMKRLIGGKDVPEDEMLTLLRIQLGPKSIEKLELMLKQGYSLRDVIDYLMKNGKTAEEELEELKMKMKSILTDGNMSPEEALSLLANDLTEHEKQKLNELIQQGLSTDEILKELLKIKREEQISSEKEQIALLRNQLGDRSKEELEQMLRDGHSLSEIIKHFISPGTKVLVNVLIFNPQRDSRIAVTV